MQKLQIKSRTCYVELRLRPLDQEDTVESGQISHSLTMQCTNGSENDQYVQIHSCS